ncbi:FAD-dependent monooxygenase [Streptomyces sp. CoH27]|uniref:FAD-dependent monooxygenase n=1 Tax=Streptomyces sp. CoH27 TaxID=2875763 RepID=UPI001CD70B81|nr:FAD-dependent monooxygenase [Streptomyces sp. CoH27]
MTEHHTADVCVVGAGPAGLALSLMLLCSGVRVMLIERASGFKREFRGEILQPGGMAVLDQLGVLAGARDRGSHVHRGFQLIDGKRTLLDIDYRRLPGPHAHLLAVGQEHLLEELLTACRQHPTFTYLGGHRVTGLLRENGRYVGAVAHGSRTGDTTTVRARFVVGADGRYSRTRRLAGIDAGRMDVFDQDVVWFKVDAPGRTVDRVRVHRSAGQAVLVYTSHPDRLQIGWTVPHGSWNQLAARGLPAVKKELTAALPEFGDLMDEQLTRLSQLTLLDVFAGRAADWVRDGLVLIGDAAHTHSPLGAQGINLALQDAAVLHPLLLDALGDGDVRTLDRFTELRARDIDAVFRFQVTQSKVMLARPNPVTDTVRPVLAGLVTRSPLGTVLTQRIAHGRTPVQVRTDLFTTPQSPKARA